MEHPRIVKVFGERNTGTRALAGLLRQVPGLRQRLAELGAKRPDTPDPAVVAAVEARLRGQWRRLYLHAMRDDLAERRSRDDPWKHALPRLTPAMTAARAGTLLMVRDPYSWLVGLARRPYHMKGPPSTSVEEFAARPWMTERREGAPAVLPSPSALWSLKARGTLDFVAAARAQGLGAQILRFEEFVQDPTGTAAAALETLGIGAGKLAAAAVNTKPREAPLAVLQDYYAAERWRERLTATTVARVNASVDWDAAAALGYARRDPADFPERLSPDSEAAMRAEMASLATPTRRGRAADTGP